MSTTSLPPRTHPVLDALTVIEGALDQLDVAHDSGVGGGWWQLAEADLLAARAQQERLRHRLTAHLWAATREIDTRGAAVAAGATSTTGWLVTRLRQAPAEAAREARLSGQVVPGSLPATHAALAAGDISPAAAAVVADTDQRLAEYASAADRAAAEQTLVGHARTLPVTQLRAAARRVEVLLDPDQGDRLEKDEQRQRDREQLRLRRRPDGSVDLAGYLGAESAAALDAALAPHLTPKPAQPDQHGVRARDTRPLAQRTAAALHAVLRLAIAKAAAETGSPVTLTIAISLHDLRGTGPADPHPGYGLLDTGLPLSVTAVRRLACDARVLPVVLDGDGQPLDIGRQRRTIPRAIRTALAIRDGGCAFPGCDRPVAWTEGHHIQHWANGGTTALTNLVLLCHTHHTRVHHDGWHVQIDPDGLPTFRPPAWIDPDRTPRRNHRLRPLTPSARVTRDPARCGPPPPPISPIRRT